MIHNFIVHQLSIFQIYKDFRHSFILWKSICCWWHPVGRTKISKQTQNDLLLFQWYAHSESFKHERLNISYSRSDKNACIDPFVNRFMNQLNIKIATLISKLLDQNDLYWFLLSRHKVPQRHMHLIPFMITKLSVKK